MKKITVSFVAILMLTLFVEKASAQYYFYDGKYYDSPITFELGGSIGAMNCLTDLGGNKGVGKKFVKDLNLGKTQIAGSVSLTAMYNYMLALRLEATFGSVAADDKVLKKIAPSTSGRYERNLSFKSKITDFMLGLEIHPLYIINQYNQDEEKEPPLFSPYLLAGVGFFSFKPQAKLAGKWVDLQPLSTEGQGFIEYPDRKPYKLNQLDIPMGLGVKYDIGSTLSLRAEFVYRKLNTDYLDDVSSTYYADPTLYANYFTGAKLTNALLLNNRQQELNPGHVSITDERGNPKNKDAFFTFNVKIGYTFGRQKIGR
jgi:opacity protein-like surface antigen